MDTCANESGRILTGTPGAAGRWPDQVSVSCRDRVCHYLQRTGVKGELVQIIRGHLPADGHSLKVAGLCPDLLQPWRNRWQFAKVTVLDPLEVSEQSRKDLFLIGGGAGLSGAPEDPRAENKKQFSFGQPNQPIR